MTEEDYSITPASIYRSLGMRNGKVYPVPRTCLVNIFYNKAESKYDLLLIYIIKYLMMINREDIYLYQFVDMDSLLRDLRRVFCVDDFDRVFYDLIEMAVEFKIVSVDEKENKDKISKYVSLLPRGLEIWNMLSNDAILLEMFRDDTYQDFSCGRNKSLSTTLKAEDLFIELSEFIEQIVSWEKKYSLIFRKNDISIAHGMFGEDTISEHIYSGLKNSCYAYYKDSYDIPMSVKKRLEKCKSKVDEVESIYA